MTTTPLHLSLWTDVINAEPSTANTWLMGLSKLLGYWTLFDSAGFSALLSTIGCNLSVWSSTRDLGYMVWLDVSTEEPHAVFPAAREVSPGPSLHQIVLVVTSRDRAVTPASVSHKYTFTYSILWAYESLVFQTNNSQMTFKRIYPYWVYTNSI